MPKQKITKEMVVEAAFSLAKAGGMEQVLVKSIAQRLGCSVQPIYSYCKNMEELRGEVTAQAVRFVREYTAARLNPDDPFCSTGKAYLQLAQEEPYLFRIFAFHQREGISSLQDLYCTEASPAIPELIARQLQITVSNARQLHLHMLLYTMGLGTVLASARPGIPPEEMFLQQQSAYHAFLAQLLNQKGDALNGEKNPGDL